MKKCVFVSLLVLFAIVPLGAPFSVDAQGDGPEGGGRTTGALPPPQSVPGAPRMEEQQIRIIAGLLSNYDGRLPFTDGPSGQDAIRALIVAEPLSSKLSAGQIDQMVIALSRYAQAESTDAESTSPARMPAPARTPAAPAGSGAEANRAPDAAFSNDPYIPFEFIGLLAGLALLGYVLNKVRRRSVPPLDV